MATQNVSHHHIFQIASNVAQTPCVSVTEKASTDSAVTGHAGRREPAGGGVSDWVKRHDISIDLHLSLCLYC